MKYVLSFIVFICLATNCKLFSQVKNPLQYVNPLIGTTKSNVYTKWGSEGGTYPGAVAPSGFIQLTPETRVSTTRGYDYSDTSIYYFSCINHSSGFPNGSSGNIFIMPVVDSENFELYKYNKPFKHSNEKAEAGYYSVIFSDDHTQAEATAAEHSGIFRFTFPPGIEPMIFIGDAGNIIEHTNKILYGQSSNVVLNFSASYNSIKKISDGYLVKFSYSGKTAAEIILKLSASPVGIESSQKNINEELSKSFDEIKQSTQAMWNAKLSVVEIDDSNEINKEKFYTALYHSLLIPWIISDVEGNYMGQDGHIHKTKGVNEYGNFSPWDTYRSLHPLLCLLFPDKQADINLSMMHIYEQTGHLPTESMTGNHSIPIIVDAYLKDIRNIDSAAAYMAMKKSIVTPPFIQPDMKVYNDAGYIPFTYPESVTRTVEYAYDDWALAQFSKHVMKNGNNYTRLQQQGSNYRNLFYKEDMFLLPRNKNEFKKEPGNIGYKEGDKWVYSYSVQQNPVDIINLMGGNEEFAHRLNAALAKEQIVFDNETVFHVPYLFGIAAHPELTQKWAREIMASRFSATPGGLPGNDDMGSFSSWFVWSALGLYPLCPGRPEYSLGSPIFKSAKIHLANKKTFSIKSTDNSTQNYYVKSFSVNNKPYKQLSLSHSLIIKGGEMVFNMSAVPDNKWFDKKQNQIFSETKQRANFKIYNCSVSKKTVAPDESFWFYFSVKNNGSTGTKVVKLFINGKENNYKNCFVVGGSVIHDSIECRLYAEGNTMAVIDGKLVAQINVIKPSYPYPQQPAITNLSAQSIIKVGQDLNISFSAQNIGGDIRNFTIPILLNDVLADTCSIKLLPGDKKIISKNIKVSNEGLQTIRVNDLSQKCKVYHSNKEAAILDLRLIGNKNGSSKVPDSSGFANNGNIITTKEKKNVDSLIIDKDCYVEVPNAYSLDNLDSTITMMLWIYPKEISGGLVDLFSKGDNHVLQVSGNKQLTFFAGGWGRGDCTVSLPGNWQNNWHHIAGVCDGRSLSLYVDGELKGITKLEEAVNLSVSNKWTVGRNEEFPLQRIFTGYMDKVKVFAAPLSQKEIQEMMNQ